MPTHPSRRELPIWVAPAMLFITGLVPLLLARTTECLSLADGSPSPEQVCTSSIPVGAWLFAGICWIAALVIFLAQRQDRLR
ncbi:hypothetical protein AAEX63_10400 [Luteococcus sp. H138]|uniref:hypothetical protein n=1 Tax=unclassified Luteococcus TaxID=2639923 RepID=UPI00313D250C